MQATSVQHIAPGSNAMSSNSYSAGSSLAKTMVDLAGSAPPRLIALRALARSDFAEGWGTDDLSEALSLNKDLERRLKSEIAKRNATPHWEYTFLRWWRDERINPIKFYALTLMFAAGLPGKRPPLAKARAHALLFLRPDLFLREGVICQPDRTLAKNRKENTNPLVGQMRKERQALDKKLKDMMWNHPPGFAPIFAQIREDWEAAIKAT